MEHVDGDLNSTVVDPPYKRPRLGDSCISQPPFVKNSSNCSARLTINCGGHVDSNQTYMTSPISSSANDNNDSMMMNNNEILGYARMQIITSPSMRMRDIFRALLRPVPETNDIFQALVNYGDSIKASCVKFLINEKTYDSKFLINPSYNRYQGPALCVHYDSVLDEEQWQDIFSMQEDVLKNSNIETSSQFLSVFRLSDFAVVASGRKIAFIDPSERLFSKERSFAAIFDLDTDELEAKVLSDQFSPLLESPMMLSTGTMIRLPLRFNRHSDNLSGELFSCENIIQKINHFSRHAAETCLLFCQNVCSISAVRCMESSGRAHEQLFSWDMSQQSLLSGEANRGTNMRQLLYAIIDGAIANNDLPAHGIAILRVAHSNCDNVPQKKDWILCVRCTSADQSINTLFILMPLQPDQNLNFLNSIRTDCILRQFTFNKRSVLACLTTNQFDMKDKFQHLPLSTSLKCVEFSQCYSFLCREMACLFKRHCLRQCSSSRFGGPLLHKYITILYSIMPDNDELVGPLADIALEIWTEISQFEMFFSETEGWGFVTASDMLINCLKPMKLAQIVTNLLKSCNVPVVEVPDHITAGLYKVNRRQQVIDAGLLCQILQQRNQCDSLDHSSRLTLLEYILLNSPCPGSLLEGLPLLFLASNEFTSFSQPDTCHPVFLIDQHHLFLFTQSDRSRLCLKQTVSKEALKIMQTKTFADTTQVKEMKGSEFADLLNIPLEWKKGDLVVTWPKNHQFFNLLWLENTWKYIRERMPDSLSSLENFNIIYVNNHRERFITLYKLSPHQSSLIYCTKECLLNPQMTTLQRALAKLDICVIDSFPELITGHSCFERYIPRLDPPGLMRTLRNRLAEHQSSSQKLNHSINIVLTDKEVNCIRLFLAKLERKDLTNDSIDCLKHLALFDNATSDVKERYISLANSSYLIYENGPKLPVLQPRKTGTICTRSAPMRPCILIQDHESRRLLEFLNQRPVEFGIAARQLIMSLPETKRDKNCAVIGKWLLTHCGRILLTDNLCLDCVRPLQVFENAAHELCSAQQFIDPTSSDRFGMILTSKVLPASDLCSEHHLGLLRSLGMRSIYDIHGDELIDICESMRSSPKTRRHLLTNLLMAVICGESGKSLLAEPVNLNGGARCTVKAFLYSFPWVPVAQKRPSGYPSSLGWKYEQMDQLDDYMAPHDLLDRRQAMIGGSEVLISDMDVRLDQRFSFKKCGVDIVVRHLKNIVQSYSRMQDRVEYIEYLNLTKECYDDLQKTDYILVQSELHSISLKQWVWNGVGGFSSPDSIFLIEKNHALAQFFTVIPYEMYAFVSFFERMGVKRYPLVPTFIDLVSSQSFEIEFSRKPRDVQQSFFQWVYEVYNDRRVHGIVNDLEKKQLISQQVNKPSHEIADNRFLVSVPNSFTQNGIIDTLKFAIGNVVKNKEIIVQCVGNEAKQSFDQYRLYDEILLPNLNVFSRNTKDSIVLLALDNCDVGMTNILKKHLCIPVTPNGHTLRRPGKLVHPKCTLSLMYSDIEGFFPYGSEDTYLRKDRLDVLKILGMKVDEVSWSELADRAELISNVKDKQLALQRANGLIQAFRLMLDKYTNFNDDVVSDDNNEKVTAAINRMVKCAFYPVMEKPNDFYPLHWHASSANFLAKPCDLVENQYWQIASVSYPICAEGQTSKETKILNFHKPSVADCLNQLLEISRLNTPINDEMYDCVKQIADCCYSFIVKNSKLSDFNQTSVRDFFNRNKVLLSNRHLYSTHQVYSDIYQSVPPFFISLSSSGLPFTLMRSILAVPCRPTSSQLFAFIRANANQCSTKTTGQSWHSHLNLFSLLSDVLVDNVIPEDLPIPDVDGLMHSLLKFKQHNYQIHPAIDYRFRRLVFPEQSVASSSTIPKNIDVNLRDILSRIDHKSIDHLLRDALTDRDPNIVLEFILAADRASCINQLLTSNHASKLLKYFDQHLAMGTGNFQKLRELNLFSNVWSDGLLTSIDQYKQTYMISPSIAQLLTSLFDKCPMNSEVNNNFCVLNSNNIDQNSLKLLLSHLHIIFLKDVDAFLQICLPYVNNDDHSKLIAAIRHLYDIIWPSLTVHEQTRLQDIIGNKLLLPTNDKLLSCNQIYRPTSNEAVLFFVEKTNLSLSTSIKIPSNLLENLPLRTFLPARQIVEIAKDIENNVHFNKRWPETTAQRSEMLYRLLSECKEQIEELQSKNVDIFQLAFIKPLDHLTNSIISRFESDQKGIVLKLSDGVINDHARLCWSSSFVHPKFIKSTHARSITPSLVFTHLNNIAKGVNNESIDMAKRDELIGNLVDIYRYLSLNHDGLIDELKHSPIIFTENNIMVEPSQAYIDLEKENEIVPFMYSLPEQFRSCSLCLDLFRKIGCRENATAACFADILCKMARVCSDDYLNSNEVRKVLKISRCFFEQLSKSQEIDQQKFDGLFLLSNHLQMKKSSDIVLMNVRQHINYIAKLPNVHFMFNPNESVLQLDLNTESANINSLNVLAATQRPVLFTERFDEKFSVTIPDDIQRQRVLHALERKFVQLLNSRTFHRSLARMLVDSVARTDMRIISLDEMEALLRSRISLVRLTCCEHLETGLHDKQTNKPIDNTTQEKSVLLVDMRNGGDPLFENQLSDRVLFTLYISFKHAEQSYFSACLARAMVTLLDDFKSHVDHAILASLISCSIGHMSKLLDLLGLCTDENVLSTLKLNYIPSPGRLYGDEMSLLSQYDSSIHKLMPGDLCVYKKDSAMIYCCFVRCAANQDKIVILSEQADPLDGRSALTSEISSNDLFVLENWSRLQEAVNVSPISEQEFDKRRPEEDITGSQLDLTEEERLMLDNAKSFVDNDLRDIYSQINVVSSSEDKKKKIKRLLLKWHPDKNQGNEKFASEVFKYLKKQIELFDNEISNGLGSSFTSLFNKWSTNNSRMNFTPSDNLFSSSTKFGGSFDNINETNNQQQQQQPQSSPVSEETNGRSGTPPSRSNSFRTAREEWQWRRQQGFGRRAGFFGTDETNGNFSNSTTNDDRRKPGWQFSSNNGLSSHNNNSNNGSVNSNGFQIPTTESQRWLKQASHDLQSANNDMNPPTSTSLPAYEWVMYKCYRAAEKALKAYHFCKSSGKIMATDIPTLLFGVDSEIRSVGYRLYKWLGDPNKMQYPNFTRFSKIPNEVFSATQAEKSLEYTKELLNRIEEIINRQSPHYSQDCM